MAAPTFVTLVGPVAFTTASSTALAYPASGIIAGDLMIVALSCEGPTPQSSAGVSGWTVFARFGGGSVFTDIFCKEATGTENGTGSVGTIIANGNTNALASLTVYRSTTGMIGIGATASGADTVSDLSYSVTTGSITTAANNLVFYVACMSDGPQTRSARTLTQAGSTLGTLTPRSGTGTGLLQEVGDRPVTAGATNPFVNTMTITAVATGLTSLVLLSEATALAIQDAAQAQAVGSLALTQTHVLAIQDATHTQTVGNVALSVASVNLIVQDAAQAQTAGTVTLTQAHLLTVQAAAHAQAADQVALTQAHILAVQDAAQAQTAVALTLTLTVTLVIQDAAQAQAAGSLAVAQVHALAVADASHAQTSGNVTLLVVVPADITVTIGPTRLASATVGATRPGFATGSARSSYGAALTRLRELLTVGPTRGGTTQAGPTRAGNATGPTRAGTPAGPTRIDRGV